MKAPYAEYLGRVLNGELGPDAPKASHGPLTVQENAVEIKWWAMSMATYLQWLCNGHSIVSVDWICCKGLREKSTSLPCRYVTSHESARQMIAE